MTNKFTWLADLIEEIKCGARMCIMHEHSIYGVVHQTAPSAALDVLHHQHAEGGSGHSGTVFVAR